VVLVKQNVARLAALAVALCAPLSATSLAIPAIVPEVGLLWIGNYDSRATAGLAPSPLTGMIGVSVPLVTPAPGSPWLLSVGLDLYGTYYEWDSVLGRAFPTEAESGSGFYTLGMILAPRFGVVAPIGRAVTAGVVVGLDVLLRLPLEFFNLSTERQAEWRSILGYCYRQGRFFYPETGLLLAWKATDAIALEFGARVLWPLFHLWDGAGLAIVDEMMATGTIGLRIALR
jgi:hypothetical protein